MAAEGGATIRVLIADDHAVLRETLRLLLDRDPEIEVVGEVGDGSTVVEEAERLNPDLVIMDAAMPGMSGIEATRLIRDRGMGCRVLILSAHGDDSSILSGLLAGAAGWTQKTAPSSQLLEAIRSIHRRGRYLPPEVEQRERIAAYLRGEERRPSYGQERPLTSREREILKFLAEGLSGKAIAERLVISPKTVEAHIEHIAAKLGTRNRAELTQEALRLGLIFLDAPLEPGD